jgi:hypothetical protein
MRIFLLSLLAISFIMAEGQTSLTPFIFTFTGNGFRTMDRPAGQPSTKIVFKNPQSQLTENYEFFGSMPREALKFVSGNCCSADPAKVSQYCPNSAGRSCCSVCQVSSADFQSKSGNRVNYISTITGAFALAKPAVPFAKILKVLQPVEGAKYNEWNEFDYYGTLAAADNAQQAGTCCIRVHQMQVKNCGAGGYCCAPCSVDTRTVA